MAPGTLEPLRFGDAATTLVSFANGAHDIALAVAGGSGTPRSGARGVVVQEALPQTNIEVRPQVDGFRIDSVLLSPSAPSTIALVLHDAAHSLGTPERRPDGGFTFSTRLADGAQVQIAPATAIDASGRAAAPSQVSLSIAKTNSGYLLTKIVDRAWLHDASYPVTVDPTVTFVPDIPSGYNSDGWAADRDCPYQAVFQDFGSSTLRRDSELRMGTMQYNASQTSEARSFMLFNLASVVPSGTPINSATLNLPWLHTTTASTGPHAIQAFVYQKYWQTAANGCNLFWYGGNGTYPNSARIATSDSLAGSLAITDTVQRWINNPEQNNGLVFMQTIPSTYGDAYASSQNSPSWSLTIDFAGATLPSLTLPTPQVQGNGCTCASVNPTVNRADPVNTATGHLVEAAVDGSVDGTPISLVRNYDSGVTDDGLLGPGWTLGYSSRLDINATTGDVTAVLGSGSRIGFVRQGDGSLLAPPGAVASLTQSSAVYNLATTDARTLSFDSTGRLTRVTSQTDGQVENLTYVNGRLASVSDRDGHSLSLQTDSTTGHLTSATLPGYGTVSYSYTTGRLSGVTRPDGKALAYGYDTAGNLASVTDGNGTVTNVYGGDGRLTQQTDGEGNVTTFAWDAAKQTMTTTRPRGGTWIDVYAGNLILRSTDPLGHATRYEYNGNGQLAKVTDANAKVTTMSYDARGNMLERIGPGPEYIREAWTYDSANQVLSHFDGNAKTTTFSYTAGEQLASQTDPLGRKTTYFYDSAGRLASTVDPRGNASGANPSTYRTTLTYDSNGFLASTTDPLGEVIRTTLDAQGRLLAKTDALGDKTTYTYNAAGRILTAVAARGNVTGADPSQYTTRYAYDPAGNLATVTDPLGHITTKHYDRNNRLTTAADAAGHTATTSYDADGNVASVTDAAGGKTTFAYDLAGRMIGKVTPDGNALAVGSDLSNYTWTLGYDNLGRQTSSSNPVDGGTTTDYDGYGRPVKSFTPHDPQYGYGWTTTTSYDGRGSVLSQTTPGGSTSYSYDAGGQLVATVDPRGNVSGANAASYTTAYAYDLAGHRISTTTPSGAITTAAYDAAGRLVSTVDPRGNATGATANQYASTSQYDAVGRLTRTTSPLGEITTYGYDQDGHQTTLVDPRGNLTGADPVPYTTTLTYDVAGQLIRKAAPGGVVAAYQRDAVGNPTSVTDGNNHAMTYTYDSVNRVASRTSATGQKWNYTYDADGNLGTVETPLGSSTPTAGDGTISYGYDAADRQTQINYSDATPDVTFTYWYDGPRHTMTDTAGLSRQFTTDWAGNITQDTDNAPNNVVKSTVSATYDAAEHMTQFSSSGGGDTTAGAATLAYDTSGRLVSVSTDYGAGTYNIGYDLASHLTAITAPSTNGYIESRSYDRDGRLSSVANKKGTTTLSSFAQAFDAASNATSGTMVSGGTTTSTAYQYDASSRLTKACWTASCTTSTAYEAYTYDNTGNRLSENRVGIAAPGTTTYTYNTADQLLTTKLGATTTSYTYDPNGNQLTSGNRTNTYDLANRLLSTTAAGSTTNYTYDGFGNRATTTVGTTVTKQLWNLLTPVAQLTSELDSTNKTTKRYTNPTGLLLALTTSAGSYNYSHDLQGSITDVTNSSGSAMSAYTYEPFGTARTATQVSNKAPASSMRFSGEYLDASGSYNLRARQYNPTSGQFTSLDPAVSQTGRPYSYASDNPLKYNDPTGLASCPTVWGFDPCASLRYLGEEVVGAGKAAGGFVKGAANTLLDPVGTIENLYHACAAGISQYNNDTLAGVLQCVDNLNPIAQIRNQFANSISLALRGCLDESAQQLSGALFNSLATVAAIKLPSFRAAQGVEGAAAPGIPGLRLGWQGRTADNGKGWVWQRPGASGNADSMRVMDPTPDAPNGYVRFYNDRGQPIGLNGKPGPNSETHISRGDDGGWDTPDGWGG